jgi:uncharacterized protein YbdZ (MbtH family)
MATIQATLGFGSAGWYVEWFQEDPAAPLGFRAAHWYGTREACEARIKERPPKLRPAREPEVFTHARAE